MKRVVLVLVVAALGILGVAGSALADRGGIVILQAQTRTANP
jgi:hypothetical protein